MKSLSTSSIKLRVNLHVSSTQLELKYKCSHMMKAIEAEELKGCGLQGGWHTTASSNYRLCTSKGAYFHWPPH